MAERQNRTATVVGYYDGRDLETFAVTVSVPPGGDPWRLALAQEARDRRKAGMSNVRILSFLEGATEIMTCEGALRPWHGVR